VENTFLTEGPPESVSISGSPAPFFHLVINKNCLLSSIQEARF
jgi:hypothetical protein